MEIKLVINDDGTITITPSKDIPKVMLIGVLETAKILIMHDKTIITNEETNE